MKKFIISTLLAVSFALNASAQLTYAFSVPATGSSNAFSSPLIAQKFSINNAGAVTNTLTFIDAPGTSATWTNALYTNYTFSVGSYTNIYTNYFGVATTNSYQAQTTTTNSVPANTNSYVTRLVVSVPPSTTLAFNGSYYFFQGMLVTNNAAGAPVVSVTYNPANFAPTPNP